MTSNLHAWLRRKAVGNREWYICIKYTHQDYVGTRVDAHYVETSDEAKTIVARGPMKPDEMLRGFWAKDEMDRRAAIDLHDERMVANRDFFNLMDRIESAWEKVASRSTHE